MKKLYLAAATFLSLSLSNAQSLTAVSSSQNILQNEKKPAAKKPRVARKSSKASVKKPAATEKKTRKTAAKETA